jgi:WD40 repeat protein
MPTATTYDAFISYSHRTGGSLGPALRDALHDFGRKWYRLRNMRVFCDRSSIAPNESLWGSIETALRNSATFILLASTESARSRWVRRELEAWQAQTPRRPVLIVVTDGEVVWNRAARDFDWRQTTALPDSLRGWFADEPLWVDLRPVVAAAHGNRGFSTADPLFLDAVAAISAAVQHRPKDELIGDDIRKFHGARRFRRLSWSGLSVLTAAALVAAAVAFVQQGKAEAQTKVALGQKLVAQAESTRADHPRDSLEYGLAANATDATPAARTAVQQSLTQSDYAGSITDHDGGVARVLYTPDGKVIISGGADGRVIFSDSAHRTEIGELPRQDYQVNGLALDSTGHLLALAGEKGSSVWDVTDLRHPRLLATMPLAAEYPNTYSPIDVAFRPHSTDLAIADGLFSVSIFSLAAPTRPVRTATIQDGVPGNNAGGETYDMAFTPDGSTLMLGGEDDTVTLWAMTTGRPTYTGKVTYPGDFSAVTAIGVDPGGHLLAIAAGSSVGLFDVTDLTRPRLTGRLDHVAQVRTVAISADGRSVVTGGLDDTATRWDVSTPESPTQVGALHGHTDILYSVAFSPDGLQVVTAGDDTTVMVWHRYSTAAPAAVGSFRSSQPVSNSAAFRPDGQVLAIGGGDNTFALWAMDDPAAPRMLSKVVVPLLPDTTKATVIRSGVRGVQDLAFSPDGRLLAIGGSGTPFGSDGLVSLYDVADPAAPRYLTSVGSYDDAPDRVAFSADGSLLATAGPKPTTSGAPSYITLWRLADPTHPAMTAQFEVPIKTVNVLHFEAGTLDATGFTGAAGTATASWDTTDPTHPVQEAAFGTDKDAAEALVTAGRRWLVTGGTDKDLTVWDTTDPAHPRQEATLDGHRGGVSTVDLDPQAALLATSGLDKAVRVWDVSAPTTPTRIAAIPWDGDQVVTALFDPARPLLVVVDRSGTVRMWDTTELAAIVRDPIGIACATLAPGLTSAEWSGKLDPGFSGRPC